MLAFLDCETPSEPLDQFAHLRGEVRQEYYDPKEKQRIVGDAPTLNEEQQFIFDDVVSSMHRDTIVTKNVFYVDGRRWQNRSL